MADLIERLRKLEGELREGCWDQDADTCREAAAAIEAAREDAEKCAAAMPGPCYMDPPDGGDVPVHEQLRRMGEDAARYRWLRVNEQDRSDVFLACAFDELDAAID